MEYCYQPSPPKRLSSQEECYSVVNPRHPTDPHPRRNGTLSINPRHSTDPHLRGRGVFCYQPPPLNRPSSQEEWNTVINQRRSTGPHLWGEQKSIINPRHLTEPHLRRNGTLLSTHLFDSRNGETFSTAMLTITSQQEWYRTLLSTPRNAPSPDNNRNAVYDHVFSPNLTHSRAKTVWYVRISCNSGSTST
jgi:hypothetical protein